MVTIELMELARANQHGESGLSGSGYTPGPWRVAGRGGCVVCDQDHRGAWSDAANKFHYGGSMICESIRSIENAKLIAASPRILEALRLAYAFMLRVEDWREDDPLITEISDAINSAVQP